MSKKEQHPNSVAHQWKPGKSGNPKGRPPGPSLVDALTRAIRRADARKQKGEKMADSLRRLRAGCRPPTLDELAESMLVMAAQGNMTALETLKQLLERLDGKVPARLEHTGADGDAIEIRQARDNVIGRVAEQAARARAAADSSKPN